MVKTEIKQQVDEKLLSLLVTSVKDYGIYMLDPQGNIMSWNKGAENIKGYSEKEIIGKHVSVFYTPDDNERKESQHNLNEALKRGTYESEGWRIRKDGSTFWANVVFTTMYDDDQKLLGFAKVTRDVTERKRAEDKMIRMNVELEKRVKKKNEKIAYTELKYRKLIENSHDGIVLLDEDLNLTYRSASAERINGWNNEERGELEFSSLIHPDDEGLLKDIFTQVLSHPGRPIASTYRVKHKLGHYIWIEALYTNMLDEEYIKAIVCNFRDVTEKKNADILLQTTNKELVAYKYALDESAIVAISDQKGIIKQVNENFCRISKYTAEELTGQDQCIIDAGSHDETFIRDLWSIIGNGKIWRGELKNKAKDGSYYWVDTTIVPFLDEQGKPYQYITIRSDITERKLAQDRIMESERFIKTITDHLPAIVVYWTSDFHCRFANKTALEYFGKTADEMIGIERSRLMNVNNQGSSDLSGYLKAVLQGQAQSFDNEVISVQGKKSFYKVHLIPDWDGSKVNGYFSLAFDITELKLAQADIQRKSSQIEDLLENMTDGFISLDENMCYIYANTKIGELLNMNAAELIGKNVWEMFPEAVGTEVYYAMNKVLHEKKYTLLEEYNVTLNLWLENRIYPSGGGISMFIRDITKSKQEEQHLKLLESVIITTSDSVLITEALPLDEPGPRIIYVNKAFTKMTGYLPEEVVGKSPRILQGPKTDKQALKLLSEALRQGLPHEITTINYKKNGEEFWINFAVSPVIDDQGKCTHFIAVERDVTERKNEELKKSLLAEISLIFNQTAPLNEMLQQVLGRLVDFGDFSIAEAWLIGTDKTKINLAAKFPQNNEMATFYNDPGAVKSCAKGEGLPGIVWETQQVQFWKDIDKNKKFIRKEAAKKVGLKAAYGLPLMHNDEVLGILVFGLTSYEKEERVITDLFENITAHFGAEIKRKQLELELKQIFDYAPDIIFLGGTDGYYKKINPAMSAFTEYSEKELLSKPFIEFVHPGDREKSLAELAAMIKNGQNTSYLENRLITKSGKVKWLAWTVTPSVEEGLVFGVAKDITDKRELEDLLNKANTLARIGIWEFDVVRETLYWSDITKEIHEVGPDYHPDITAAINFYKQGKDRETMVKIMDNAILNGTPCDAELQIITTKGNTKWVRVIVEAEFVDDKCIRAYGSLQDIDARKKAEIAGKVALEERNIILESIDDAFFAVDKNWVVTYWNNMAEKVLMVSKDQILDYNLWEVFSDSVGSKSYEEYHWAVETNHAAHFEDYYESLAKWYEISAYPSDKGLSVYFKDITDRKTSEMRLKELNESLKKHAKELAISNAELEQFAYVASHDLQEPLRMVTSFLTQLEKKYSDAIDAKGRQYIYFAVDGAKRMRQIILDLLEFSRVGRTEDDLEEVNFNKLINEITALYRRQIEDLGANIIFEDLPTLSTYKTPVRQVFQNLIGNSLKYHNTSAPPLIEISCKETKTHYQFAVQDNGIGISEEYFDKIFIIFQRLHNKDEYSGTGMGLALAKKIVENLGGKIWLKSTEGKGSTFYFTLLKDRQV